MGNKRKHPPISKEDQKKAQHDAAEIVKTQKRKKVKLYSTDQIKPLALSPLPSSSSIPWRLDNAALWKRNLARRDYLYDHRLDEIHAVTDFMYILKKVELTQMEMAEILYWEDGRSSGRSIILDVCASDKKYMPFIATMWKDVFGKYEDMIKHVSLHDCRLDIKSILDHCSRSLYKKLIAPALERRQQKDEEEKATIRRRRATVPVVRCIAYLSLLLFKRTTTNDDYAFWGNCNHCCEISDSEKLHRDGRIRTTDRHPFDPFRDMKNEYQCRNEKYHPAAYFLSNVTVEIHRQVHHTSQSSVSTPFERFVAHDLFDRNVMKKIAYYVSGCVM